MTAKKDRAENRSQTVNPRFKRAKVKPSLSIVDRVPVLGHPDTQILSTERLKEMTQVRAKTPNSIIRRDGFFTNKPEIRRFKDTGMFLRHGIPDELFVNETQFDRSKQNMTEALRRIDKSIADSEIRIEKPTKVAEREVFKTRRAQLTKDYRSKSSISSMRRISSNIDARSGQSTPKSSNRVAFMTVQKDKTSDFEYQKSIFAKKEPSLSK